MALDGLRRLCELVSISVNWQKIYVRQIHDIYMATIKKGRAKEGKSYLFRRLTSKTVMLAAGSAMIRIMR